MMRTKASEIAEILRMELEQEKYPVGTRFPAENELADRFEVGTATANRATEKLQDLGYLIRKGSRRDGLRVAATTVFPRGFLSCLLNPDSVFHTRILSGALRCATAKGYALVPFPYQETGIASYERILSTGRFSGTVTMMHIELKTSFPVVYADITNLDHVPGLYHVRGDLRTGCAKMVRYLQTERHCSEIIYCHSCRDSLELVPRRLGFLDVLRETGDRNPEKRIFSSSGQSVRKLAQTVHDILEEYPRTDAIVCENDENAHCVEQVLRMNFSGGRKIIVTGFGNLRHIQDFTPFPTVEQHPEETGFRAISKLIRLIERPEEPPSHLEELPVELILPSGLESQNLFGG